MASRHSYAVAALGLTLALAAAAVFAQEGVRGQIWRGGFGGFFGPPRYPTANTFHGEFNFCRLAFTSNRREKRGWSTDYPGADINFSVRLAEITKARVTRQPDGDPEYVTVSPTDDALFKCGFVLIEDGGSATFTGAQVVKLREYLLKGGFIFASDYWGSLAKDQFDEEIGRVLPKADFPIVDLPPAHPLWHMLFDVPEVPQMASIQYWRRSGGGISERGADSAVP